MNGQLHHHQPPYEAVAKHRQPSVETCGTEMLVNDDCALIVPHEDDIEKSFRVNQDGSMTVEMKVHLTIKEEEVLHWTTTVSRSLSRRVTAQASISQSGNNSPDLNNHFAKDSPMLSQEEMEDNCTAGAAKVVGFNDAQEYGGYSSTTLGKHKTEFKRTPTPGPRHVNKTASVESVKTVTESGVHESTVGHYSYMARMADGEMTEGYCLLKHSSSNRPIPKPRKTASAGANKTGSLSSEKSSGEAEVLEIESNGMEVTETVMHIYENEGCYDNYYANEEYSIDSPIHQSSVPAARNKTPTVSDPRSTNSDCDIDFSPSESLQRQKDEMLSLSSEPGNSVHEIRSNLPSVAEGEHRTTSNPQIQGVVAKRERKKRTTTPGNKKSSTSTSSSDQKQKKRVPFEKTNHSSTEKLGSSKKIFDSAENVKKTIGAEKAQIKKVGKGEKMKDEPQLAGAKPDPHKKTPFQRQTFNKAASRDHGYTVNASTMRPQMKKNMQDNSQSKKSLSQGKRTTSKPKSMIENKTVPSKDKTELPESFSMPSLNPSPSEVHQYVENWLEKVSPNAEDEPDLQRKVVFQIGADSGSDGTNGEKEGNFGLTSDDMKKSSSSLSVPLCHAGPATLQDSGQYGRGLCVSMPSVRHDHSHEENRLKLHKSVGAIGIGPIENASTSQTLSSKERMKPLMQQLCSSVQCIQSASGTRMTTNLEKAKSMPDFSMQVASVFGSSCRAFLSFLSVMTLRDNLNVEQPKSMSEATIMMESLQKIAVIDDEEEQRASLTELQSRTSSQFRERWMDFQTLRERLQSEPLSPRVSETEFALDVVSEGGDAFEDQHSVIDELMEELNMPPDLRAEISSTIQHAKCFYPADESTFVEVEKSQSESEVEDVEKFVDEHENHSHASSFQSPPCQIEAMNETEKNHQGKVQDACLDVTKIPQTERDETLNEYQDEEEIVDFDRGNVIKDEDGEINRTNYREETESEEKDMFVVRPETESRQDKWNTETGSEEEKSEDGKGLDIEEKGVVVEAEMGSIDEEDDEYKEHSSTEETDEREGAGDTEGEKSKDKDSEAGEGVNEEEVGTEDEELEGVTMEADEASEEEREGTGENIEENILRDEADGGSDEVKKVTELTEEEEEEEGEMMEDVTEEMEEDGVDCVSEEQDEGVLGKEAEEKRHGKEAVACEEESTQEEYEKDEGRVESGESVEIKDPDESLIEREEMPQLDESAHGEDISSEGKGSKTEEEEIDGKKEECEGSEDDNSSGSSEGLEHAKGEGTAGKEEERRISDDEGQTYAGTHSQHLKSLNLDFQAKAHFNMTENVTESPTKCSSEEQCEDDKGNGTDSVNETETDEGAGYRAGSSSDFSHPVEISQELLDFVNSALQSSSLIFTYDSHGNVRLEPDKVRALQTKQSSKPQVRKSSSYGLKCLPSPVTSDLSDYRPETSESGGYKTQDSVDVLTESGEDSPEKPLLAHRSKTHVTDGCVKAEQASGDSFSSFDSENKASREDLSYFSAGSSSRTDAGTGTGARQDTSSVSKKESSDGVLIDRGRWLLKENHLIRRSPPQALGMYGNIDSSSVDTSQDNISEGSPPHNQTQHNNPLAAISSSELEEMAKPQTPKCTYYNMPHGSDSDPFHDDASLKSADQIFRSSKKRGFKVSPTIDTSKTWASKNGSLSSFTSVEFKIPDGKVHPEGETSAALQARRTSSGRAQVVQPTDSWDTLHTRCNQYCPIL